MPAKHFRSASKDLKRADQIEDLGPRRGHEHDPSRSRWDLLLIIKVRAGLAVSFYLLVVSSYHLSLITIHDPLSAFTNLAGAASNVSFSSWEQK